MSNFREHWKVNLPEGSSGDWRVEYFKVSKDAAAFESIRAIVSGTGRGVPEGRYTALYCNQSLVMSDTLDEMWDHMFPIHEACDRGGRVLINGLGLGMVAAAILMGNAVEKVTVIENSPDVIALVGPTLTARYGHRLEIIEADAFEYKPPKGQRFSVVWHDIWNELCTDNLKDMGTLHRRYGNRCDWQGSWGKEILQHYRRQGR